MIRVKCSNPNCTSPTRSFDWDETAEVVDSGGIAQPHERGAVRVIAVCPFCVAENVVWVKGIEADDVIIKRDDVVEGPAEGAEE